MTPRALPALFGLAALVADLFGSHSPALVLVLCAIPAAFALTLDCYGDALEGQCGGLRPLLACAALLLFVFSAALRSPAVVGGVPQLAISALVIPLLLYAAIAVGTLLQDGRAVPESA